MVIGQDGLEPKRSQGVSSQPHAQKKKEETVPGQKKKVQEQGPEKMPLTTPKESPNQKRGTKASHEKWGATNPEVVDRVA